jgi:hypothetical protein
LAKEAFRACDFNLKYKTLDSPQFGGLSLSKDEASRLQKYYKEQSNSGYTPSDACELFRRQERELSDAQATQIKTIKIPFFNCSLDIDDLGLVSGSAFLITLLWFRSVLWSERRNINVVFAASRATNDTTLLMTTYELLSMHQNLMAPEAIYSAGRSYPNPRNIFAYRRMNIQGRGGSLKKAISCLDLFTRLLMFISGLRSAKLLEDTERAIRRVISRIFVYFMCCMPTFVQLGICIIDFRTLDRANLISGIHANWTFAGDCTFLFLDIIATLACIHQLVLSDFIWESQWTYITSKTKGRLAESGASGSPLDSPQS